MGRTSIHVERHPLRAHFPPFAGYQVIESTRYYGKGYEDVQHRKPSIRNAQRQLGWTPTITTRESVERTVDWFLQQHARDHGLSAGGQRARTTAGTP